jgi:hypothetical protein
MTADGFKLFVYCYEYFSALVRKNRSVSLLGGPTAVILCMKKSAESRTAKTVYRNSKQEFPETKLRGLSPDSYINVLLPIYVYIPRISLPILLQENMWTDRGNIFINRSQTHECGNWD